MLAGIRSLAANRRFERPALRRWRGSVRTMGIGSRVRTRQLFGISRPIVVGLAFGFTILLNVQAGHAQSAPPAPGSGGSTLNPYATSSGCAKQISVARGEKCRTKSVQD